MASTQTAASWLSKNVTVRKGTGVVYFANNSYLPTLQKTLYRFYQTGKFCDVTVACLDISYQAHSVILASSCPYFDKELESGEEEIYLPKSISAEGFEPILEYLYTGNLRIHDDTYSQIKTAAHILEIRSVCVLCDAFSKIASQNKGNATVKNVGKNEPEKQSESDNDSTEKKSNSEQKSSASTICTNNMIPESLRSSLSVSVASSGTNSSKPAPTVKRLNSGLEIIPISGPTDPKQAKKNSESQSSNHKVERFDYEELDDLSDSEEYYSDEDGMSDYAEEEAMIRELEKKNALNKAKQEEQRGKNGENSTPQKAEDESAKVAKPS